jgi:hypothetical protein
VRIGIIDTGFFLDHEVFRDIITTERLIATYDFINDDENVRDETENDINRAQSVHGTAVWSQIGGYNPSIYIGAAYGAEFLLAKPNKTAPKYVRRKTISLPQSNGVITGGPILSQFHWDTVIFTAGLSMLGKSSTGTRPLQPGVSTGRLSGEFSSSAALATMPRISMTVDCFRPATLLAH